MDAEKLKSLREQAELMLAWCDAPFALQHRYLFDTPNTVWRDTPDAPSWNFNSHEYRRKEQAAGRAEELRAERDLLRAERDVLKGMLAAAENSYRDLKQAVTKHHDQKADDRCWMDDAELYRAAGFSEMDAHVGDQDAMLKNCQRFIACRTMGGKWKSYAELESDLAAAELQCRNDREPYRKLTDERDTLAQRVAELEQDNKKTRSHLLHANETKDSLEKELHAVRVCFAEASQSAGPTTVHVDTLKARCAKLETALRYPRYGNTAHLLEHVADFIDGQQPDGWISIITPHLRRAARECAEALNQAPA